MLDFVTVRDMLLRMNFTVSHRAVVVTALLLACGSGDAAQTTSHSPSAPAPAPAAQSRTIPPAPPEIIQMGILDSNYGVAFGPYMAKMRTTIQKNWVEAVRAASIPPVSRALSVEFWVAPDGKIKDPVIRDSSGMHALDGAALKSIRKSSPFDPLPSAVNGHRIHFLFEFGVRLAPEKASEVVSYACKNSPPASASAVPLDRIDVIGLASHLTDVKYAVRTLCQRGINFAPDQDYLSTLAHYGAPRQVTELLAALTPKSVVEPTPERARAYEALDFTEVDKNHGPYLPDEELFARALESAPDSATLQLALARMLFTKQEYSAAEAHTRKSIELWPENADAQLELALILLTKKQASEAMAPAREAVRIAPDYTVAQYMLGTILIATSQFKDAVEPLRAALPLARQIPILYKNLGVAMVHAGQLDDAIEPLNNYLKIDPNDTDAHYALGVALRGLGKTDEAIAQFREAVRLAPDQPLYAGALNRASPQPTGSPLPDAKSEEGRLNDGFLSDNIYNNRFFNFSYEFPAGWQVQDAEAGKRILRAGKALIGGHDPINADIAEMMNQAATTLLVVAKLDTKELTPIASSIQIQVPGLAFVPKNFTAEDFIRSVAGSAHGLIGTATVTRPPEQFAVDGHAFWRFASDYEINKVTVHVVEAATKEKGYLLIFVFSSRDIETVSRLEGTLQKLKFAAPAQ
jgi:TonB family protein